MPEVEVQDPAELAGAPDAFQRLWTPHRMVYIQGGSKPNEDGECPFCTAPTKNDEDGLIVARGEHAFVVMNLFPYSPGHLLICPYRHVPDYTDVTVEETREIAELTQLNVTQVKVYIYRGRTALKNYIGSLENVL